MSEFRGSSIVRSNNFKKGNYKIGDKLEVYDFCTCNSRYVPVKIISISDKGSYNMYTCENLISGCRVSFTDKELNESLRQLKIVRG